MLASEVLDDPTGNRDDHCFGTIQSLQHRLLRRARPVANAMPSRSERLPQGPTDAACADDRDIHLVSLAFFSHATRSRPLVDNAAGRGHMGLPGIKDGGPEEPTIGA